jgi:hypothetical protein
MARHPHRLLLLLAALPAAGLAATTARADTAVAQLDRATPIAAHSGVVAWSEPEGGTRRFRLVLRQGGAVTPAAIAPDAAPFDVSLGRDAAGRLVALYSRCRQNRGAGDRPSGCDVYRYDVAAGREELVKEVSRPDRDELWPAQSGRRVAFVALRGRGPASRPCDVPYVKTLGSAGPARRLDSGLCARTVGLSLQENRVVQLTSASRSDGFFASEVRLLDVRSGRMKLLSRAVEPTGGEYFGTPSLSATAVYLMRSTPTDQRFVRIELPSGRRTETPAHIDLEGAFARDERGVSWYVETPGRYDCSSVYRPDVPCRLVRTSASPFSSATRRLAPLLRIALKPGEPPTITGRLERTVVRGRRILRREPLAGVAVELLAHPVSTSATLQYLPTGLRTTTGANGSWTIRATGRSTGDEFLAVTVGPGVASYATAANAGPRAVALTDPGAAPAG